jgi:hypothetical protein
MQRPYIFIAAISLVVLGIVSLSIWRLTASHDVPGRNTTVLPAANASPRQCHEHDGLPDSGCTPGSVSVDVSQASIGSTICSSGYTSHGVRSDGRSVRPPTAFTEQLKVSGIAAYGYPDTAVADYEEDHLIPLELGGDGWSPANLWPESRYGPHPASEKDQVENELHRLVCSGQVSLSTAQHAIASNWETALAVA